MRLVDQWFEQNSIDARWINDKTFWVGDTRYLYLRHKQERGGDKIFSPDFAFLIDTDELEEFMTGDDHKVDYYCFEFGGKIYYSAITDKPELNLFKHIGKAKEISGFDYLGIHGGFELCSGSRTYDAWCEKAKFLGITTLGLCEKHTLAGALKFQLACAKHKIKSIIGETINIKLKEGQDYKVKVYVANAEGWENLLRIHKCLNIDNDGKFVQQEELIKNSEGLYLVFNHDTLLTDTILAEYLDTKFLGIYFQFDPVQYKAEKRDLQCLNCLKKALEIGIDLALICDSYYLDQEDNRVKQILQFIGNVGFEYQSDNQHFKSLEDVSLQTLEMFETKGDEFALEVLGRAMKGLKEVSEGCGFSIKLGEIHLPKYPLTEEEKELYGDTETLFWHLIEKGLQEKVIAKGKDKDVYLQRIETEYDVISRGGFVDYFLTIRDILCWCESNGIMVGTGRGSAAGSLCIFLLGLVKVDPIEYGLIFERFLNISRVGKGLPDIDSDLVSRDRDKVKRYMEERFGKTNVCSIGTYSILKSKSAFRDTLRFYGEQPQNVNYFSGILDKKSEPSFSGLFKELAQSEKLKQVVNDYPDLIDDIPLIIDQPRSTSIHPSGIIITPTSYDGREMTVFDWMPCKVVENEIISEWEGIQLDDAGFLKADMLGLSQLDKLTDILKLIEKNRGIKVNLIELDKEDKSVYELFHKGFTQDVFQFTTDGLSAYCREAKPDSITELATLTSLYRPGAMDSGAHTDYVKIKFGKKQPEYDWGTEEITKGTYALYVFQEQAIKIVQVVGGFTLTEADGVRKATGKKLLDKMQSYKEKFVAGAIKNGCPEYEANKIWNKIEAFAGYSFNLSHAVAYSLIGYQCQWLKKYYPLEFWTIALQYASEDEILKRVSELRKFDTITLHAPNINKSIGTFYTDVETNSIYWSLAKVKFVGDSVLKAITEERDVRGTFFSLEEFIKRLRGKRVNKRAVLNLILAGAFDEMYKIGKGSDRIVIVQELNKLIDEDLPEEYKSAVDEFTWYRWQKQICGYGYFDYTNVVVQLGFPSRKFVQAGSLQLSDNLDKELVVAGLIAELTVRKTRKGDMVKITLDSNDELVSVVLWNDVYEKHKNKLAEGRGIVLNGKLQYDNFNKNNCLYSFDGTLIEVF